ncbi:MAG TPA: GNAT family N-acetyltransferase [Marmoricola sp.]|nr:GNAT family N-acetyltransferase [Marmoricola sp.]
MTVVVAPLTEAHWPEVEDIYAAGIATGHATFEAEPPSWAAFDSTRLPRHRFVVVDDSDHVLGWVAASAVSERSVYAGVVEHSVYVAPDQQGRGIGRTLLQALVDSTEAAGIWTIQSGIFPENAASLAVHRAAGFEVVGTRRRIGRMGYGPLAGTWRDVVAIERRSDRAGTG